MRQLHRITRTLRRLVLLAFAVAVVAAPSSSSSATASARVKAISAGLAHTCALTSAGGVECWGYNGHDELGRVNGSADESRPGAVSDLGGGVTAVSAGVRHSCALTSAGGVRCWGAYYSGALGDGTAERHAAPVVVSGLSTGVTAVTAGYDGSCALLSTGGVKCWGLNDNGQRGDGTRIDRWTPVDVLGLSSGVRAIATAGLRSCALSIAGGVECWGYPYGPTPVVVPGLGSGVISITTSCAVTNAGGVKCWAGGRAPVDVPGLDGVTEISTDSGHTCALTRSRVKCWGLNDHGQLGDGTAVDRATPVDVVGLAAGVTAISAGGFHSCAVTRSGGAKCWGDGPLGDGTNHESHRPVSVSGYGAKATVALVSGSVRVTSTRTAAIKLRCGAAAACRGTLALTTSLPRVALGRRSFSISASRRRTVTVRLNKRGFDVIVHSKRVLARARISYRQPDGGNTTITRTISLVAPRHTTR